MFGAIGAGAGGRPVAAAAECGDGGAWVGDAELLAAAAEAVGAALAGGDDGTCGGVGVAGLPDFGGGEIDGGGAV